MSEELAGRSDFSDLPLGEIGDPVRDLTRANLSSCVTMTIIMRSSTERANDLEDLPDELGVERRGDLVEEQNLGTHRERPGNRHPLLLSARELVRVGLHLAAEADPFQQSLREILDLGLRPLCAKLGPRQTFSMAVMWERD